MMLSRDFLVNFGQDYVLTDLSRVLYTNIKWLCFLLVINRDYFFIDVAKGLYSANSCDFFFTNVVKSFSVKIIFWSMLTRIFFSQCLLRLFSNCHWLCFFCQSQLRLFSVYVGWGCLVGIDQWYFLADIV